MTALTVDYKSAQVTIKDTLRGNNLNKGWEGGAKLRHFYGYFKNETGSVIAQNAIINMMKLPAGVIVPHLSRVKTTDLGTGTTLEIGTQEHQNNNAVTVASAISGIVSALDVATAAVNTDLLTDGTAAAKLGYTLNGQTDILAKITGSTMATNGTIELFIVMAVE